jgi:hypothetical protein
MSKNVGWIHVRVLGFTRQGLGLKNEGKLQLVMWIIRPNSHHHTHRPIERERERERASNTEKLSEKSQQQQQQAGS